MALPAVRTTLQASTAPQNAQDISAIAMVVGPCSAGQVNKPTRLAKPADLAAFGFGPGIELAAEIGATAGWPLYFTRSATTTASQLSSVTKTPGNAVGVPATFFGLLQLGSTNGLRLVAKAAGVTVTVVVAGNNTALSVPALAAQAKDIIINLATDGGGAATSTASDVATAIAAQASVAALVAATATGNGSAVLGAQASYSLDKGALSITPKAQGVTVTVVVAGNNTALAVSASGSDVTLTMATGASGLPTSTATQVKAAIEAAAPVAALIAAALVGDGAGTLAARAQQALQFGSTAALSASGTPVDAFGAQVQAVRGGAVGGTPAPTVRWSADAGASWTSEQPVPANGVVQLRDVLLDTGLTVTLSGSLDAGDLWTATSTAPSSSGTDLLTAYDAALAAPADFRFGFLVGPDSCAKVQATQINSKVQAALQVRFVKAFLSTRDIAEGVANETEAAWVAALIADFQGFVSSRGLLQVVAAPVQHLSPYTGRSFRRPGTFAAGARRASSPMHENLGRVKSGPLANVTAIYHDESQVPGLHDQRFITTMIHPQRAGYTYFAGGPTMADPSDTGWTLEEWVTVALSAARAAAEALVLELNDSLPGIGAPEPDTGAPKGALTFAAAQSLQTRINAPVEQLLTKAKTDGKSSVSPQDGPYVEVLRNNNYLLERIVNAQVKLMPLGLNQVINLGVSVRVPA